MYPSLWLLPIPMLGIKTSKHILGPARTLDLSQTLSRRLVAIRQRLPVQSPELTPSGLHFDLGVLFHLTPRPFLACFETACAFQLWLGLHGIPARVCLGKRVDRGQILMHAWVETDTERFFYDDRFIRWG